MQTNWENWLNEKWVVPHRPSAGEIADLLHIADRDLEKTGIIELGPDWRLSIAHNAAIQTAKAALAATGFRARTEGQHYLVLQSLSFTLETEPAIIDLLDKFRKKRNISDYERVGMVSEQEAEEMIALAKQLRNDVELWLRNRFPELAGRI